MDDRLSIRSAIERARRERAIALLPFIPAGYPDLATTAACVRELAGCGASAIEIGFPFSDPVADGPAIQQAFSAALASGVKVSEIFATIESVSPDMTVPLLAMLSYSMVFRIGVENFVREARAAGFSGLIIPDLPPPEAQSVCAIVRAADLDTVLLVAPSTSPPRRREITRLCSGFVYYLSVAGVTGERDELPPDVVEQVRQLKRETDVPVCVGFGIHRRRQLEQLIGVADGAIVGTAIVRRMKTRVQDGADAIAREVREYFEELRG